MTTPDTDSTLRAERGQLLRFSDAGHAELLSDGLLVTRLDADGIRRIVAVGDHAALGAAWGHVPTRRWQREVIAPGFIDTHVHAPQVDVIGSPADGLLPWLTHYTFPHETRWTDPAVAAEGSSFFIDQLLANGVTTALVFATSHVESVDALMAVAHERGLRLIAGKVLQDRHSPDGLRDDTAQSLRDTEALIRRWHGVGRLGYAITPRFAPTSSEAQLRGAGELASQFADVWIQSHVAENTDEVAWVHDLFPWARSYLDVYEQCGLLRQRAVYAHGIYLDDADRALLRERDAAIAVCPTSNAFLGSGLFDFAQAQAAGFHHALASDVGGGTSLSPFATMLSAYTAARAGQTKVGITLSPERLWWLHTVGAAQALGLDGVVGNLQGGAEADWLLLDPDATPLLSRRTRAAQTLAEWLFALIVLGDDRAIVRTEVAGAA